MPGKQKDPVHDHFVDVVVRETVTDDKGVETVINKTKSIEVPAALNCGLHCVYSNIERRNLHLAAPKTGPG